MIKKEREKKGTWSWLLERRAIWVIRVEVANPSGNIAGVVIGEHFFVIRLATERVDF